MKDKHADTRGDSADADQITVRLSSGMSFVIRRVLIPEIIATLIPALTGYKWEETEEGWVFYREENGNGYLITRNDALSFLRNQFTNATDELNALDPIERQFCFDLDRFRKVEKKLEMAFWKKLRKNQPDLYVRLVKSVIGEPDQQEIIESVEKDLRIHSRGWENMESIKSIDESRLTIGIASGVGAESIRTTRISNWRRYDRAVKQLIAKESPYSAAVKKRLQREHKEMHEMTDHEKEALKALKKNLATAYTQTLPTLDVPEDAGKSEAMKLADFLNPLILNIVNELLSPGMSKKKSFILTDKILHILLPRFWQKPDDYSYDRVRQRYTYWSKKNSK